MHAPTNGRALKPDTVETGEVHRIGRHRLLRLTNCRFRSVRRVAVLRDRQAGLQIRLLRLCLIALDGTNRRLQLRDEILGVELREQLTLGDVIAFLDRHRIRRLDQGRGNLDVLERHNNSAERALRRHRTWGCSDHWDLRRRYLTGLLRMTAPCHRQGGTKRYNDRPKRTTIIAHIQHCTRIPIECYRQFPRKVPAASRPHYAFP